MSKFKVCRDNKHYRDCKEFDSLTDLIEWAQGEIKKDTPLKIGDKVKVIDTGKCYSNLSEESLFNFYAQNPYGIGEALEIVSKINHDCLGFLDGIKSLPDDEFEVVAIFSSSIDYLFIKSCDFTKHHGFYIIAKEGVEKWR